MADTKITGLTNFDSSNTPYWPPAPASDVIPIVDISDATMAASGTTKKISINNLLSSSPTATGALTVTGLVTAGSATITGALTVDTTTLVANAAGYTDKVGVGTATPAATLHIKGSGRVDSDYNLFDFYKDNGSTRLGYLLFRDDGANYFNVNSNQPLYLSANNTVQVQVETSGDVKINTGNVVMGTSGKGIDFTAAGNVAGMTSELLNDYEEGTWTPTLQFSTLSVGVTYSTQTGIYTKVGRIVHFSGRIDLSSKGTSVGSAAIAGLPFAANTGAASVGYQSSIAPSGSQAMLTIGGTELIVRYASTTTTAQSTDSDFSNSSIIIFAGTYAA